MKNLLNKNQIYLIICGLLQGLVVVGGKYFSAKGLSLFEISILFPIPSILIFGTILLVNKQQKFKRELLPLLLLYGGVFCLLLLSQFGAVILGTPASAVVFLLYTQPLWTILFSKIFLKERLTKIRLIASLILIPGVLLLAYPFNFSEIENVYGIIIALVGGLCISGWVVIGGLLSKKGNPDICTSFSWSFFGLIFLIISYPLISNFTTDTYLTALNFNFSISVWIQMFLYGFLTIGIGTLLYLKGIQKVPVSSAGIILLLEPVSGALLAYLLFEENLTANLLFGAAIILIANILVIIEPRLKNHSN